MRNIIAKYKLGISQGKEIIEWAYEMYIQNSEYDVELLRKVAFLDKNDSWDITKAEELYFDYFNESDDKIVIIIKEFFLQLLKDIENKSCKIYEMCDIVYRINEKYKNPKWTNNLNGYCVYLRPDSTYSPEDNISKEIKKTINDLEIELKKINET